MIHFFEFSVEHAVMQIRLTRPRTGNPLTPELCRSLASVLRSVPADPRVRALALYAAGPAFSVAADHYGPAKRAEADDAEARLADALRVLERPLVVGVQGECAGAGLLLVAGAARVLAAPDALFLPDAVSPAVDDLLAERAAARLSVAAQDLLGGGTPFSAREAIATGLAEPLPADQTIGEAVQAGASHLAG